jgi:hypothetical protein
VVLDGDARFRGHVVPLGYVRSQVSVAISDFLFDIPISLFPTLIYFPIPAER